MTKNTTPVTKRLFVTIHPQKEPSFQLGLQYRPGMDEAKLVKFIADMAMTGAKIDVAPDFGPKPFFNDTTKEVMFVVGGVLAFVGGLVALSWVAGKINEISPEELERQERLADLNFQNHLLNVAQQPVVAMVRPGDIAAVNNGGPVLATVTLVNRDDMSMMPDLIPLQQPIFVETGSPRISNPGFTATPSYYM